MSEAPVPPGLAEFMAHIEADELPAVAMIDRDTIRALLRYVRRLELEALSDPPGSFW
jgi:hypothetical protein